MPREEKMETGIERRMNENDLQKYLDLERTDIDPEMFAAALAVEHVTQLIAWGQ